MQKCENIPVTAALEVPNEKCYKKPRKVCQTLVSTKPKVVTVKVPREHCGLKIPAQNNTKLKAKSTRDIINPPSISRNSDESTLNGDRNPFNEYFEENLNRNDFRQFYEYLLHQNSQNIRGN